jgi:hypothetical protein
MMVVVMLGVMIRPMRRVLRVFGDGDDATIEEVTWLKNELHIPTTQAR